MEHSPVVDGFTVFMILGLVAVVAILSHKLAEIKEKYKTYHDFYHKDDDIKVERADVIPLEFRTRTFQLGNLLVTLRTVDTKPGVDAASWKNFWGTVKLSKKVVYQ